MASAKKRVYNYYLECYHKFYSNTICVKRKFNSKDMTLQMVTVFRNGINHATCCWTRTWTSQHTCWQHKCVWQWDLTWVAIISTTQTCRQFKNWFKWMLTQGIYCYVLNYVCNHFNCRVRTCEGWFMSLIFCFKLVKQSTRI